MHLLPNLNYEIWLEDPVWEGAASTNIAASSSMHDSIQLFSFCAIYAFRYIWWPTVTSHTGAGIHESPEAPH